MVNSLQNVYKSKILLLEENILKLENRVNSICSYQTLQVQSLESLELSSAKQQTTSFSLASLNTDISFTETKNVTVNANINLYDNKNQYSCNTKIKHKNKFSNKMIEHRDTMVIDEANPDSLIKDDIKFIKSMIKSTKLKCAKCKMDGHIATNCIEYLYCSESTHSYFNC